MTYSELEIFAEEGNSACLEPYQTDITTILQRKNLNPSLFETRTEDEHHLTLNPKRLEDHVSWVYHNIYSVPYITHSSTKAASMRTLHGIQHTTRAALFVMIFVNLYRKYNHEEVLALTREDVLLLQIAALFHDSAREAEGVDKWDHESALFLYFYLTKKLGIEHSRAKLFAEAAANKDKLTEGYFEIRNEDGVVSWGYVEQRLNPENIYQKIIHDADCIEIIRAVKQFDVNKLFYYEFINKLDVLDVKVRARRELGFLLAEQRSLLYIQGDFFHKTNLILKSVYENAQAYQNIMQSYKDFHQILSNFSTSLLPVEIAQTLQTCPRKLADRIDTTNIENLNNEELRHFLASEGLFARGVARPSGEVVNKNYAGKSVPLIHTHGYKEVRKLLRAQGIPTITNKPNKLSKHGNKMRSVTYVSEIIGSFFTNAGYFSKVDFNNIIAVYTNNNATGFGKKSHLDSIVKEDVPQINTQLKILSEEFYLGRREHSGRARDYNIKNSEILVNIDRFAGIFYTQDPTVANFFYYEHSEPFHSSTAFLEAIYLQNMYAEQYLETRQKFINIFGAEGEENFLARFGSNPQLPIFECSSIHNQIRRVTAEELTEEKILWHWEQMCVNHMYKLIKNNEGSLLYTMSLDDLKVYSMYGQLHTIYYNDNKEAIYSKIFPADHNYTYELREQISEIIESARQRVLQEYEQKMIQDLTEHGLLSLDDEVICELASTDLRDLIQQIPAELKETIINHTLDEIKNITEIPIFQNFDFTYMVRHGEGEESALITENNIHILITNPFIRMYLFMSITESYDAIVEVQEMLCRVSSDNINNIIENLREESVNFTGFKRYCNLIMSINVCWNLFWDKEVVRTQFENVVSIILQYLYTNFINVRKEGILQNLKDCIAIIHTLIQHNMLSVTQLQYIEETVYRSIIRNDLIGYSPCNNIAANIKSFSLMLKKPLLPEMYKWLVCLKQIPLALAKEILEEVTTVEDNEEKLKLFKLVICRLEPLKSYGQGRFFSEDCFIITNWINSVHILCCDMQLSAMQLSIIQKRLFRMCDKFCDKVNALSDEKQLKLYCVSMEQILQNSINLKMPQNIITNFTELLTNIVNQDIKLNALLLDDVLDLHDTLPQKEDRNELIVRLVANQNSSYYLSNVS